MSKQLRVAIALAALRHKPPHQSLEAYILDLQAAFSLRRCSCQTIFEPTDPWRDRVVALEKDIEDLRSTYDQERLELLTLRKAAQSHPVRPTSDDARETNPTTTPSTTAKKGRAKKNKPLSNAAAPAAVASPQLHTPAPTNTPAARTLKLEINAILQGEFAGSFCTVPGPSTRISAALEAADALVGMLTVDSGAVPIDLTVGTTLRALKAIETMLLGLSVRFGPCSDTRASSTSSSGAGLCHASANAASGTHPSCHPASTLSAVTACSRTLISTVMIALLGQSAAAAKNTTSKKLGLKRVHAAETTAAATAAAIDDVLGGIYGSVLTPAVRAFVSLSEGYLSVCLANSANSTTAWESASNLPDLRPEVFVLLEGVLATLDDTLGCAFTANPVGSPTAVPATSSKSPAPVEGTNHVRTLLALECVRELDNLFLPGSHDVPLRTDSRGTTTTDGSASQHTGAHPGTPSDSLAQGYLRSGTTTSSALAPDSATAAGSGPHSAFLSASQTTRAGTASGIHPAHPALARPPPRAARNLGVSALGAAASAPGCEPASAPARHSVRAGAAMCTADAVCARGGSAKRGGRAEARIAKLARKDAAWWLCAVLDRLLPSLPPPRPPPGRAPAAAAGCGQGAVEQLPEGAAQAEGAGPDVGVANDAVYTALAELLRRTRAPAMPRRVAVHRAHLSPSSREHSPAPCASDHAEGSEGRPSEPRGEYVDTGRTDKEMGLGAGEKSRSGEDADAEKNTERGAEMMGARGAGLGVGERRERCGRARAGMRMGEVERGMLLAVLERAWLGV